MARLDSLAQEMDRLATVPLLYDPGERWVYGLGHDVQARLVEAGHPPMAVRPAERLETLRPPTFDAVPPGQHATRSTTQMPSTGDTARRRDAFD